MPDQQDAQATIDAPTALSAEIGSSLATVWARYVGARPTNAESEVDSGVVRWVLTGGTSEFEKGMSADSEGDEILGPKRTMAGYKRETAAAVAKVTHRRVVAMISKHDTKTGTATEVFILEPGVKKY
jgi:uncharacterized protein YbcI